MILTAFLVIATRQTAASLTIYPNTDASASLVSPSAYEIRWDDPSSKVVIFRSDRSDHFAKSARED